MVKNLLAAVGQEFAAKIGTEGLGARLAYDVTVAASEVSISAEIDPESPERSSASLTIQCNSLLGSCSGS